MNLSEDADPFLLYNPHPIEKSVEAGLYDMYLYFHECDMGYRVAYALIEFDNKIPSIWEYALTNDSLLEGMGKTTNGLFPVDAGLLCVSDKESFKAYDDFYNDFVKKNPDGDIYDDYFAGEFAKNGNNPEGTNKDGDWINYQIDKEHNVIMFSSGLGDGLYPAYWGLDEKGKPLKLLVDLLAIPKHSNRMQCPGYYRENRPSVLDFKTMACLLLVFSTHIKSLTGL